MLLDLNNLTKTVTNVYNELSKNEHPNGNESKSKAENDKHSSNSSNLKPHKKISIEEPSSEEKEFEKLKEKNANLTNGEY